MLTRCRRTCVVAHRRISHSLFATSLACVVAGTISAAGRATAADVETLFVRRIEPLLTAKCAACHGADAKKSEGGLSLASGKAASAGGDSGT
ncbi:MAG: c-type cytochrome domain-containing protein, partial [Planctomycetia bacterium]